MSDRTDYIGEFKKKFSLVSIEEVLNKISGLNVLVIGDTIIDQYVFVKPKGRAVKDPILSAGYISDEKYAGGILAIANHLSDFVKKINLVTIIGDKESREDFIKASLKSNINLKTFVKLETMTTVKKRFVDVQRNSKLFKVEYLNDSPIDEDLSNEVANYLTSELPKYDLVIVGDFGHGFIDQRIRSVLEKYSKFLAVNVQSNSANMGFNYFTLYKRIDFLCGNEEELRLPVLMRFDELNSVIKTVSSKFHLKKFLVTQSRKGCIFVNGSKLFSAPIITESVKDTVGAGDALFALSSLFVCVGADDELVPFIANCAGGIKANIMGNKESVTKDVLYEFIKEVLK